MVETKNVNLCLEFICTYVCATTTTLSVENFNCYYESTLSTLDVMNLTRSDETLTRSDNIHPIFEFLSFYDFSFSFIHGLAAITTRETMGELYYCVYGGGGDVFGSFFALIVFGSFVAVNILIDDIVVLWH